MIYAKLLEFQKQGITLKKDGTNPHFKSSYVTLNEVLDKVKKPLNDLGVVIVQRPTFDEATNQPVLLTLLVDTEDKDTLTAHMPFIGATDMQKLGGAMTYARRYSLIALLGLEDEDLDGEDSMPAKKNSGVGEQEKPPFDI